VTSKPQAGGTPPPATNWYDTIVEPPFLTPAEEAILLARGWAKGGYVHVRCQSCGNGWTGAKRAEQCWQCAGRAAIDHIDINRIVMTDDELDALMNMAERLAYHGH
jgi:hypothetical protein